jgi:hypothetical protein
MAAAALVIVSQARTMLKDARTKPFKPLTMLQYTKTKPSKTLTMLKDAKTNPSKPRAHDQPDEVRLIDIVPG